jgi:hypothetical protein
VGISEGDKKEEKRKKIECIFLGSTYMSGSYVKNYTFDTKF